ncbi:heme ABC transporter ATP-binding protein [Leucobacter sp. UCMA 4100]|uniref:heme ABC transporter ATP-binding protein n=1 Tax=Leucobacter sp. UCMA 4100 TaxID=2810534 RepID=UPI0022EAF2B5|nr:heme ABC transporter ATP-binding protein [Leucobacter sp. UCMA 4100]MDA3147654.1 heme ABC transporter ATP-binding protein [Leucobacter sp. UCMA 4100]
MNAKHFIAPTPQPAGTPVFEAVDITVERGGRKLLDEVSIDLRAGEILALLGPNGAGKSTLMAALSGDLPPDGGEVRFTGQPLTQWNLRELSRRRSVLLQDNQVLFPFTVHQVVEMGRAPWRRTPLEDEDPEAIDWAIDAANIRHLGNRRVPTLSGGERARTAFARVIAGRTGALMLDEPTAALDLGHQEELLQLVRQRADAGDAVLIVVHDLNLAASFADRIALLSSGKLVTCGSPEAVLTESLLTEVYETPVEVIRHPVTGRGIVLPRREV